MNSFIGHSKYEYGYGDDTYLITENTTRTYPLCEHLKSVVDSFLSNEIIILERAVIECVKCKRRLDLQSMLEQYKK